MRTLVIPMTLTAMFIYCATGTAATYHGHFDQPAGIYSSPSAYNVYKDDAVWTPGNVAFSNPSSASGPNNLGLVRVTAANVTSIGDYHIEVRDSGGEWRGLSWRVEGPVDITFAGITGIDSRLSTTHGSGVWDATGSVAVLPYQGTVSYEAAAYGTDVHVVRGDSVAIPYTVGEDITGWTVYFAAKANPSDDNYAIGPIDVTAGVTDASTGSLVNLDTTDTAILPRRYSAELEIRNGQSTNTPLRFRLWVDPDVIR